MAEFTHVVNASRRIHELDVVYSAFECTYERLTEGVDGGGYVKGVRHLYLRRGIYPPVPISLQWRWPRRGPLCVVCFVEMPLGHVPYLQLYRASQHPLSHVKPPVRALFRWDLTLWDVTPQIGVPACISAFWIA